MGERVAGVVSPCLAVWRKRNCWEAREGLGIVNWGEEGWGGVGVCVSAALG
jgi:hypothetical protein